ncbi:hypothetical protein LUZ60_017170 [Juncus effusus]|nr:hypothetical protein LUZ60_017170 [Juncus effusus]
MALIMLKFQVLQIQTMPGRSKEEGLLIPLRRSVISSDKNSSYTLAASRTQRKDPLNSFQIYTGGWNISNENYWASVGFSAAPIFAIGFAWFIIFGIFLFFMICCCCCCASRNYSYSQTAYTCSLILLILFTIVAILGCVVLYDGQGKFHESTTKTSNYVLGQANETVYNLRNFSDYLSSAKLISLGQFSLEDDVKNKIDDVIYKINVSADQLASTTSNNSDKIQHVLDVVGTILIVVAAIMLLLAFLGFCWLLVTGTFILSGVFLLLHNIVSDTCVSMDEWVLHPQEHTALDDILPCFDSKTTNEALQQSKNVTYEIIDIINGVITNVSNQNLPPQTPPPLNYNQSGPSIPQLCNPYNSDLTDRPCSTGDLHFDTAQQVWNGYICNTTIISGNEICTNVGRLTPTIYSHISSALNVSYGIYYYGPYLSGLADCTFVRQTFKSITENNCPSLERYSGFVYGGLLVVSVSVMLSLVFWILYARERRERKYQKRFLRLDQPMHNRF